MEEQENIMNVTVIWRGNKYMVEMNSGAFLKDLGDELRKLTDVKADTMRLIVPQFSEKGSKMLHPFSDEHSCLSLQEASIARVFTIITCTILIHCVYCFDANRIKDLFSLIRGYFKAINKFAKRLVAFEV